MKKLRKFLIWSLVFLLLLTGLDQVLLRVPMDAPVARELQTFYRDFRGRLFALAGGTAPPPSIDAVIERAAAPAPTPAGGPADGPADDAPRYLYVDRDGALQFADSLTEVPEAFRGSVQQLKE